MSADNITCGFRLIIITDSSYSICFSIYITHKLPNSPDTARPARTEHKFYVCVKFKKLNIGSDKYVVVLGQLNK